jgi:maltooligosyltrehalose trehalohydrolase
VVVVTRPQRIFQSMELEDTPSPEQGARCSKAGVSYRIWAPCVSRIELEIFEGKNVIRRIGLAKDAAGFHAGRDEEGRAGNCYKYRLDDGDSFPDPASRWQPFGVHGPSMVVDARAYRWESAPFERPPFRDLVIYELHVGAFTPAGTFRGAIERIPYLRALGVSAIELMPVADFPGERNWGYDGVSLYAPAHSYGQPDDLRALVDAAHAQGIAVILDVVYNHFGPDGNYLHAYIGDYLDEKKKTPWGGAIRYGSPEFGPLREFVIDNPRYWMEEFRIDGFRLDATHAIVDESPRHILAEITEVIHARGGYAIAEDSRNDARVLHPVEEGGIGFDGVWADDFHHVVRVANTHESEAYLSDFFGTVQELVETIEKGWFYHGQASTYSGRPRGTPADNLPPGACVHCISNHDQVGNRAFGERLSDSVTLEAYLAASALLCLTPHTPLLFMGQEWAASTPFLFFTHHNDELGKLITAGRREEFKGFAAFQTSEGIKSIPDPQSVETFESSQLDWNELQRPPHAGVLALYRACIALRREDPTFRPVAKANYWVKEPATGICAVGLNSDVAEWIFLVDLVGGHGGSLQTMGLASGRWKRVLSTREPRFGGDGGCALADSFDSAHFERPEAILLKKIDPVEK